MKFLVLFSAKFLVHIFSQIGRAATISCVDEVVIFDEYARITSKYCSILQQYCKVVR